MSTFSFKSVGLKGLIKDLQGYTDELNSEIVSALNKNAVNVQRYARKNHRFTSRDGKLEQSVSVEQKLNKSGKVTTHSVKIFLNSAYTTTKSGKSYATYIHEGTYQGYKKSPIAQPYGHSTSKSGNGWIADPFLYRAISTKWKFGDDLNKIADKLNKKYRRK